MLKALFSAVLFASAALAEVEREDHVMVLGDKTLPGAIEDNKHILVEFYAPWCGHCKTLAPEYAKAAEFFSTNEEFDVELAKVDATEHPESASTYGVQGYPTIKFFKNGEALEYTGGRTSDEIVSWLKKKTGPVTVAVSSTEDLEALKANNVVVVFSGSDVSAENDNVATFTKVAESIDDAVFATTTDASVVGATVGEDKVVLFKSFDEERVEFDGELTKSKLAAFVNGNLLPYVIDFSDEVAPKVFGGNIKEHVLYFRSAAAEGDAEVVDEYRKVAKAHSGELLFIAVDMDVESNARIADFFGVTAAEPAIRIINIHASPIKYVPLEDDFEFTEAGFEKFVSDYVSGALSAHLKSEDVPEDWDEDDVKVIVGKNFKATALNENLNVFLMAHAPWCGHCKSLLPTWVELAQVYAEDESVMIAKMDATANEVEAFQPQGFPTLKFFPANGNGKSVDYEGERDLAALKAFVKENAVAVEEDEVKEDKDEL